MMAGATALSIGLQRNLCLFGGHAKPSLVRVTSRRRVRVLAVMMMTILDWSHSFKRESLRKIYSLVTCCCLKILIKILRFLLNNHLRCPRLCAPPPRGPKSVTTVGDEFQCCSFHRGREKKLAQTSCILEKFIELLTREVKIFGGALKLAEVRTRKQRQVASLQETSVLKA